MAHYAAIKVIIADDHEVYRDGLRTMLSKNENIEVVGEAGDGNELIRITNRTNPDIILTDIIMPSMNGIEATKYLTQNVPAVSVIALSMFNEDNLILDMLEAGAKGYLLKNANKSEIIEAVKSVYHNTPYYCRSTSIKLARLIASSKFNPFHKVEKISFNDKEIQIIRLICEELTNKEIANKLFLSIRTVEGYRQKIMEKTTAKTTAGIVIYAIKHGMYKI